MYMSILLMIISVIQSDGFRLVTSTCTNIFLLMNYLKLLKTLHSMYTNIHTIYIYNNIMIIIMTLFKEDNSVEQVQYSPRFSFND